MDDIVAEVRAAGPPRRDRGHAARAERQLLRPRHHPPPARCSPTCCAPSVRSRASGGSASPARTRRTCAPRPSRRWPTRPRSASSCTCPLQSGSDRGAGGHAAGLHGRALPRAAGRGPRRPSTTWPSRPTSSSGSPARPRRTSSDTLAVVRRGGVRQRLHLHLLAPPGHPGRRHGDGVRPGRGDRRAVRTAADGGGALRAGAPPGPGRPDRGGARRGRRAKRDPAMLTGRTRQSKLVHFAPPSGRARPDAGRAAPGDRHRAATPTTCPGDLVEVTARPSPPGAHPAWPALERGGRPGRRPRRRASRRRPWTSPAAGGTSKSSRSTPCASTGAWTSGRPSPAPRRGPRCPTTWSTWWIPTRSSP